MEFLTRSSTTTDGPWIGFGGSDGVIRVLSMGTWQVFIVVIISRLYSFKWDWCLVVLDTTILDGIEYTSISPSFVNDAWALIHSWKYIIRSRSSQEVFDGHYRTIQYYWNN